MWNEKDWATFKRDFDEFLRNPGPDVKEAFRKLGTEETRLKTPQSLDT